MNVFYCLIFEQQGRLGDGHRPGGAANEERGGDRAYREQKTCETLITRNTIL